MTRDPRIDAYIAEAQPFAQPVLNHVRERVHAVLPEVVETLKWGMPAYTLGGKIVLMTAAFKAHLALNFWRGQELRGEAASDQAMGQFGRIRSMVDLPPDPELDQLIRAAAELSRSAPAPRRAKTASKPSPAMHPAFEAALSQAPEAKAALEAFPPSCRREYLEWIAEAKREETRAKRIATAIAQLAEGKRLHWKYERC
jgi:uncharacterized protein YdeI (YjbR/CyaY-like superfamily)